MCHKVTKVTIYTFSCLSHIAYHIWLWQSCTLPKQTKIDSIRSYIPVFICLHWPNNLKHIWKTHIKNYANGLHFVVFHCALLVVEFIHIFQCCYTERAVIIRLRQRQWNSLEDHMDPQKHTNVCNIHVHISLRWELRICTDRLTPSLWFKLSIQCCSDNRKPPRWNGYYCIMMTSSNGNIFRVTGHLCGKFTGPRWVSLTKASDAELWCFLWITPE